MVLSRILGGLGRFCISLGVLTLLFVAYQLWGTGLLTAQAQGDLDDEFDSLVAEADAAVDDPDAEPDPGEDPDAAPDADTPMSDAELRRLSRLLWRPAGEPVAKISAPTIGLDWTAVEGVGSDELTKGPGHYPGTPMPGMPGNVSIAGHRTTWGAPFNRIDELVPGDEITVRTVQGVFVYRVVEQEGGAGHFIVTPDRVDVLAQDFEDHPDRLTLTACHPKYSARQRIVVVAELVGDPAPFIPPPSALSAATSQRGDGGPVVDTPGDADGATGDDSTGPADDPSPLGSPADADGDGSLGDPVAGLRSVDDFGEGLDGDPDAVLPAITWAVAALSVWATAAFAAARWRRWPSYAVGVVPFALVLFVCFVFIDRAIPSY